MIDPMTTPIIIAGHTISRIGNTFQWTAGLAIDCDGAFHAYHPDGIGLDDNRNARNAAGKWVGVITDADGQPVIQGPDAPAPGYMVSGTALVDPRWKREDPRRYVDASTICFLVAPPALLRAGLALGDVAWVTYKGRGAAAIFADVGPSSKIGEGSPALARALGIDDSPRHGGVGAGVSVVAWLQSGTHPPWPRSNEGIAAEVATLRALL